MTSVLFNNYVKSRKTLGNTLIERGVKKCVKKLEISGVNEEVFEGIIIIDNYVAHLSQIMAFKKLGELKTYTSTQKR